MKLLLNGGGGSEELKPALKILDKIMDHNKPLLYIPLAMDEADHPYDECYKWFLNVIADINITYVDMVRSFEELSSLNLNDYSSIFIGGGNTYKLLKGIKDNNIFEKINEYLNNGGIIMGGSAGAVIFGKDINIIASMDNNEVDLKDTKGKSFKTADIEKLSGKVNALPRAEQIDTPVNAVAIVELYNK